MSRGNGLGLAGREIQTLIDVGVTGNLSDGQLLDRFIARREEAVFRAILLRHGAMIWGVCRRVLGNHHDAEDAFQATCLVLARKAESVSPREKVGPWLYGVAYRTALKARQNRTRRRLREGPETGLDVGVHPESGRDDSVADLDRELSRLPEKYRVPIVLCELEGKSYKEAAEALGWPIGTVSVRISRAKTLLADRLTRRGVTLSAGSLTVLLAQNAASARLIDATARAACLVASGNVGVVSVAVLALTQEACRSMLISKLKMVAVVVVASATVGVGGVGVVTRAQSQEPAAVKSATKTVAEAKKTLEAPPAPQQKDAMKATVKSPVPSPSQPFIGGIGGGFGGGYARNPVSFGGGPDEPNYVKTGNYVFVTSPKKDAFTVYNIYTSKSSTIKIPVENGAPRDVRWIQSGDTLVLLIDAPKITRLDVYSFNWYKWYSQELKEPASRMPVPAVGNGVLAYRQGRYVYAFSSNGQKWGVLELPEGVDAAPVVGNGVIIETDGHIYEFGQNTGVWKHTDLREAIKAAMEAEKKGAK